MKDNFNNDKEFPIEKVDKIKDTLNKLDNNLEIPESIKPENIKLKTKKKFSFIKIIPIAACFLIFISMVYVYNKFNSPTENTKIPISGLDNKDEKSKYTLKSIDELKNLYMEIRKNQNLHGIYGREENILTGDGAATPETAMDNSSTSSKADGNTSETNVQVEGVDEGDIVKTDGNYIYSISDSHDESTNYKFMSSKLIITSTLRTGEMKVVSSTQINGGINEIYLCNNKLIAITNPVNVYFDSEKNTTITQEEYSKLINEIFKNDEPYDEKKYNDFYKRYITQTKTSVFIYDVTNPEKPSLLREFSQEGNYLSSRLIDDNLYLVSNKYEYRMIDYTDSDEINPNVIVPFTIDSLTGGKNSSLDLGCITICPNPSSFSYTIVSGININSNEPAKTEACLGGGNTIYSSKDSLYVMTPTFSDEVSSTTNKSSASDMAFIYEDTNIIKYSLNSGEPKFASSGKIPGTILNQFSADEYNGYFRIATTKYSNDHVLPSNETSSNNVYILNDSLEIVGKIEDLAPGERIYSVRFMNDKGYVVTFKQVDPLFSLDLSDPQNPKVTGQLKIPGFSSYLHPYDENLLIGIGNDTLDTGDFALMQGLKLSLFDISNPNDPKEVQNYILGGRGTSSEVLYDHKALLFSKEKNIIGFPVVIYDKNDIPNSYENIIFNGYIVFNIDPNTGFTEKGRVSQYKDNINNYPDYGYEFHINRGIFVDDVLYTISNNEVMATSLNDFSTIQKLDLQN